MTHQNLSQSHALDRGSGRSRILHRMLRDALKTHTFLDASPAWASLPETSTLYVGEALLHPECGSWIRILCGEGLSRRLAHRLFCDSTGSPRTRRGRAMGVLAGCVARSFEACFDADYHYVPPTYGHIAASSYEPRMLASVVVEGGGILFCDHQIHRDLWPER